MSKTLTTMFKRTAKKPVADMRPTFDKEVKILSCPEVAKKDEETCVRLYKAITDESLKQNIDIKLIYFSGIPTFKKTIGEDQFRKVWRYFEKGYRENNEKKKREVYQLLSRLVTVENACHYIQGYDDCVTAVAKMLIGAPEEMSTMERAKFMRAYMVLFGDYHFFVEDFMMTRMGDTVKRVIVDNNIVRNNKEDYRPERLILLYDLKLSHYPEGSFIYSLMMAAVEELEKDEKKEFYRFAELSNEENHVKSINEAKRYTFSDLRKLKMRISPVVGKYPAELFIYENLTNQWNFVEMYELYRILTTIPEDKWTTSFPIVEEDETYMEGSVVARRKKPFYKVGARDLFASKNEMNMFVRYFEYFVEGEYELNAVFKVIDTGEEETEKINLGLFMAAQKYFQEIGYYDPQEIRLTDEFFLANVLFTNYEGVDQKLRKFAAGKIDAKQFREEVGITADDESKKFCLVVLEDPIDAFERFMAEEGFEITDDTKGNAVKALFEPFEGFFALYAQSSITADEIKDNICWNPKLIKKLMDMPKDSDVSDIKNQIFESIEAKRNMNACFEKFIEDEGYTVDAENRQRLYEIVYEHASEEFDKYEKGELSKEALIKAIGYDKLVMAQIVDLNQVNIDSITQTLADFKARRFKSDKEKINEVHKIAIYVWLYDYLVSSGVKCGPNHKKVKPAKNFKIAPFKKMLEA